MTTTEAVLAVLTVVGFAGSVPQLWGSNWSDIWLYYRRGIIPWEKVHKGVCRLIAKMRAANYNPSVVIGVGRGGIICAGLVCSELTTETLVEGRRSGEAKVKSPKIRLETINSTVHLKDRTALPSSQAGDRLVSHVDSIELSADDLTLDKDDRILLVVAQNFTGNSLQRAADIVMARGIPRDNIVTACVFWQRDENVTQVHEPDLYGATASIRKTMPWKYSEVNTDRF